MAKGRTNSDGAAVVPVVDQAPAEAMPDAAATLAPGSVSPSDAGSKQQRLRQTKVQTAAPVAVAEQGSAALAEPSVVKKKAKGKRANGEGSVTQLADGRWQARVTLGGGKRKAYYGATRKEASDKLKQALADQGKGKPVGMDERQTVGQFLTRWLEAAAVQVGDRTVEGYRSKIKHYVIPQLGAVRLAQLQPAHLEGLYLRLMTEPSIKGKPLAARSVLHAHRALHTALAEAERQGLVARNVASLVRPPRVVAVEQAVLSQDEAVKLLAEARGERLGALIVLAVTTGMRWGEMAALRWPDVDLASGRLTIRASLKWHGGPWQLKEPKSKRVRIVDLPVFATAALRERYSRQLEERLRAGDMWEDHGFVFSAVNGSPVHQSNFYRDVWNPMRKRLGLAEVKLHGLRHTHGTLLREAGEELDTIRERLGHSSIKVTADIYGHITPKMRSTAARRMQELLGDDALVADG